MKMNHNINLLLQEDYITKESNTTNQALTAINAALAGHGNTENKLKSFDVLCVGWAWIALKMVTVPMSVW